MQPGDLVAGRFDLERAVGAGGMGTVFLARDRATGDRVAVKVLYQTRGADIERFAREAELLADLRHPAVVRYVAHGATRDGERWLVTEYLQGVVLSARLTDGPLGLQSSLSLARRLAEALGAAHERGVIHRDVKPANVILVGGDVERAKILDFGVARTTLSPTSTQTGAVVGTPGYMAPEQARGGRDLTSRVDVFSLGCVIFECITGRPAFSGEHMMALLAKIVLEDMARLNDVLDDVGLARVPDAVEDLVARMTAKDIELRPRDGKAVAAEIATLDAAMPGAVLADPPSAITGMERRLVSAVLAEAAVALAPTQPTHEWADRDHALAEVVASHGGRLEPLADGSVAAILTGAGVATDQAARAARCALAMRQLLPDVPMALATGRADTGRAVGDAIDRAVRLLRERREPLSRRIGIDELTAGLLDVHFEIAGAGRILELNGMREVSASARTVLGKATPCVGRERELALLEGTIDESADEPIARAVIVTGAVGVGKSRVRDELLRSLSGKARPMLVLSARGDPMRLGSPFGLIGPAIRRAAGIGDAEPVDAKRQKLRARVSRYLGAKPDVARVVEFVGELCGVPFTGDGSMQLAAARQDAMLMRDQVVRALVDWLGAECESAQVVLVLDDLHWGDEPTVRVVDAALRALAERPFAVIAFARPEVRTTFPNLWIERSPQEVRLGELSKKSCERIVRAVLGDAVADETVARVFAQSQGNPLYIEELVRAVASGRQASSSDTVVAMLASRMEALERDARRVLRAASVFGQTFRASAAAALLAGALEPADVTTWLRDLVEREVLVRTSDVRDADAPHAFRHGLLREAAYSMLTEDDRRLGHRLAARWLEETGEADARVVAEHHERGGEAQASGAWWLRAAAQALDAGDLGGALDLAGRAIERGVSARERGEARLVQCEAQRWLGDLRPCLANALEALELVEPGHAGWYDAFSEILVASTRTGQTVPLAQMTEALVAASPVDATAAARRVIALARGAWVLLLQEERGPSDDLLERAARGAASLGPADRAAVDPVLHRTLGLRAAWQGDLSSAARRWEVSVEGFDRIGNLRDACGQRVNLGFSYLSVGQVESAERVLREALDAAASASLDHVAAGARHNLGVARMNQGALDEALVLQRDAAAALGKQGDVRLEGGSLIYLSKIQRLRGELAAAESDAQRARELLDKIAPMRVVADAALAHAWLAAGRVREAVDLIAQTISELDAIGGIEDGESYTRLVHVHALRAAGRTDDAKAAADVARRRILDRAQKIQDPEWRKSFLERVPDNAETLAL